MIPPFSNVGLEKMSNEAQNQEQGDYPEAMERFIDVTFKDLQRYESHATEELLAL
jgi:hypothetical protein